MTKICTLSLTNPRRRNEQKIGTVSSQNKQKEQAPFSKPLHQTLFAYQILQDKKMGQ